MKKILLLRPGALGDVLALHGPIRFLKQAFPGASVGLAAPGARGAFLRRPGLADTVIDWENRDCSWLFSSSGEPPPALADFFARADLVIAYFEPGRDDDGPAAAIRALAPGAAVVFHASAPPDRSGIPIGEWLARAAFPFADKVLPRDKTRLLAALATLEKIPIDRPASASAFSDGAAANRYAVIHPGSGSARKNWRLDRFAELGRLLTGLTAPDGTRLLDGIRIVAGEADGDLGAALRDRLPGARLLAEPDLETLAALLARARLYIGNDSGVSHLAGAVADPGGRHPEAVVLFGPSDSAIWKPPGALAVEAGPKMDAVSPAEVSTLAGNLLQKRS